jgi:hypothetical protein
MTMMPSRSLVVSLLGSALLPSLLATLVATLPDTAHAQWKWRDKNGQITVSDLPPPREVQAKDILSRPPEPSVRAPAADPAASAPAAAPAARPAVDPELQARKKAAEAEQASKAKAEADGQAAQRAENCRNARAHLQALESGQRIARFNEKGEREVPDDKQRATETFRARAVIASDCR